jgi:hypothetical protein
MVENQEAQVPHAYPQQAEVNGELKAKIQHLVAAFSEIKGIIQRIEDSVGVIRILEMQYEHNLEELHKVLKQLEKFGADLDTERKVSKEGFNSIRELVAVKEKALSDRILVFENVTTVNTKIARVSMKALAVLGSFLIGITTYGGKVALSEYQEHMKKMESLELKLKDYEVKELKKDAELELLYQALRLEGVNLDVITSLRQREK